MGVSNAIDHNQSKIKMPNHSQGHPASSNAPNQDLKDIDILCIFKIKRKRAKMFNIVVTKTIDHIQIKIKMPNPGQEPLASSKVPNEDLKDMDVLCTFKIRI